MPLTASGFTYGCRDRNAQNANNRGRPDREPAFLSAASQTIKQTEPVTAYPAQNVRRAPPPSNAPPSATETERTATVQLALAQNGFAFRSAAKPTATTSTMVIEVAIVKRGSDIITLRRRAGSFDHGS